MDECQTSAGLDIAAANPYYGMQDHLDLTAELERPDAWVRTGVDGLIELADRGFAMKQARYLVTETNAQAIHVGWQNLPPYPGQILQAGLALVARGAAMIEYWHWHTLHFGAETYWGGVLPHSQVPGRIYAEVKELGERLETLGNRLDGYVPDHDVTVLFSNTSKYAFEVHPLLANADGSPRTQSYLDIVEAFRSAVLHSGPPEPGCCTSSSSTPSTSPTWCASTRCWSLPASTPPARRSWRSSATTPSPAAT